MHQLIAVRCIAFYSVLFQGFKLAHRNTGEKHEEKVDAFLAKQTGTLSPVTVAYLAACRSQVGTPYEITHAFSSFRTAKLTEEQLRQTMLSRSRKPKGGSSKSKAVRI